MVKDGNYLVKHRNHIDGIREREITIKDGIVIIDNQKFSQKSFFQENVISRTIS